LYNIITIEIGIFQFHVSIISNLVISLFPPA
jgi:hypothetical protein